MFQNICAWFYGSACKIITKSSLHILYTSFNMALSLTVNWRWQNKLLHVAQHRKYIVMKREHTVQTMTQCSTCKILSIIAFAKVYLSLLQVAQCLGWHWLNHDLSEEIWLYLIPINWKQQPSVWWQNLGITMLCGHFLDWRTVMFVDVFNWNIFSIMLTIFVVSP